MLSSIKYSGKHTCVYRALIYVNYILFVWISFHTKDMKDFRGQCSKANFNVIYYATFYKM